ncbi:hypothetical protein KCU78_g86, partial [Aureobasidium melanogenum]
LESEIELSVVLFMMVLTRIQAGWVEKTVNVAPKSMLDNNTYISLSQVYSLAPPSSEPDLMALTQRRCQPRGRLVEMHSRSRSLMERGM